MGDRANIYVKGDKAGVWLYTHWCGTEMPQILQRALARKERWEDTSYLTRIIFCEMLKMQKERALTDTTGMGISSDRTQGEYPLLVVDPHYQRVHVVSNEDSFMPGLSSYDASYSMEEFCCIKLDEKNPWDTLKGLVETLKEVRKEAASG